ncbi:hypothetical protein [Rasiella sp. SM2506]|uniref:hypothetical protein n=1 Tax=Rasiella sp. SM2506 TaxID=3423914 RepID=UPI003D7B0FD9
MKVVHTFEEVNLYWLLNGKGTFPSTVESEKKAPSSTTNFQTPNTIPSAEKTTQKTSENNSTVSEIEKQVGSDSVSNSTSNAIDRIVIFYADGSFKEYLP